MKKSSKKRDTKAVNNMQAFAAVMQPIEDKINSIPMGKLPVQKRRSLEKMKTLLADFKKAMEHACKVEEEIAEMQAAPREGHTSKQEAVAFGVAFYAKAEAAAAAVEKSMDAITSHMEELGI